MVTAGCAGKAECSGPDCLAQLTAARVHLFSMRRLSSALSASTTALLPSYSASRPAARLLQEGPPGVRRHLAQKLSQFSPDLAMNSPRLQLLATSRLRLATSASATFCSEFHSCAIVKLTTTSSTVSRALSEVHYASFSRSELHCSVLLTRSGGGVFQVYFRCISGGPQAKESLSARYWSTASSPSPRWAEL